MPHAGGKTCSWILVVMHAEYLILIDQLPEIATMSKESCRKSGSSQIYLHALAEI
jgi:hypothetical protein